MALESLLHVTHAKKQIQAVNVTDGIAFAWKRLLRGNHRRRNHCCVRSEIIAEGMSAVYAVGVLDGRPKVLFCYPVFNYNYVFVQHQKRRVELRVREGRWQDLPILQSAVYFDKGWINIRVNREA